MLSARNQLKGTIRAINIGGIMAEVIIKVTPKVEVVSVITRTSAENMKLKVGDEVTAIIKSTEVMVAKD